MVKVNKKQAKKFGKIAGVVTSVVALVVLGVFGTLSYQKVISNIKAEGVAEFKIQSCDPYANDKGQKWLECDE